MSQTQEYRVLARKYRPKNFDELIGQEALVRTLSNAIASGRLAHAFILTGVRGIGKTTTARIIARALNCENGPTTTPCGVCANCIAIAEDRHVDVLEMDAASNTGVDDVREIIDSVKYAPASARYKVYIIDEVHMLSKNAFNALLKTLEEPPPHVKFIFATTEIRKVPITVLSRCQRFDLRRVTIDILAQHFINIAAKESWTIDEPAAALIAKAADGSVRDGLSILDHAGSLGEGTITYNIVAEMLGLADRAKTDELFRYIYEANSVNALETLSYLYDHGADPIQVIQDLLDICHHQTRQDILKDKAGLGRLSRIWQVLLKGLQEVASAPQPVMATEMLIVRSAHVSGLPTPSELVEKLYDPHEDADDRPSGTPAYTLSPTSGATERHVGQSSSISKPPSSYGSAAPSLQQEPVAFAYHAPHAINSFDDVLALAAQRKEAVLHTNLFYHIHPVSVSQGHLEIAMGADAAKDLPNRLSKFLRDETGRPWMVTVSQDTRQPTHAQQQRLRLEALRQEAEKSPVVQSILLAFPGSTVIDIQPKNKP